MAVLLGLAAAAWAQAPEDTTLAPEPVAAVPDSETDTTFTSPDPGLDPDAAAPYDTTQAALLPPAEPLPPPTPPTTLDDLDAWLEYKARAHAMTLPLEARVFYARALRTREAGQADEALRLMRGAAQLDPSFLEPQIALIGWLVFREPTEAMAVAHSARQLVRRDFSAQWTLTANLITTLIQAWYLALIATAFLVLMARQADIRHGLTERLNRWVSGPTASLWSWALMIAPFVTGFGLVLPTVFYLGMGWGAFRWRERTLFVTLIVSLLALPIVGSQLTQMATPMRPEASSLASLIALETQIGSAAAREPFLARAEDSGDPYLEFGKAWIAHHDGDLASAEAGYRRALTAWPDDDRVLNDLGHVLVQQGRAPEAIETFQRALAADSLNATVYFNLSQAYTRNYDFESANAAIARASDLDFDLVSRYKAQPGFEGSLPLVSQWLAPKRLWRAVATGAGSRTPAWPPAWRGRPETMGLRFVGLVVLLAAAGVGAGLFLQRRLPQHLCTNCNRVVCRRCSVRRRAESLCRACTHAVAGAESPEFVRMLLARQRDRHERLPRILRPAFACLVPGLGLALHRRVFRPFLIALLACLGLGLVATMTPYTAHPRCGALDSVVPTLLMAIAVALSYVLSIVGYFMAPALGPASSAATLMRPSRPAGTRPRAEIPPDVEAA